MGCADDEGIRRGVGDNADAIFPNTAAAQEAPYPAAESAGPSPHTAASHAPTSHTAAHAALILGPVENLVENARNVDGIGEFQANDFKITGPGSEIGQ